VIKSRGVRQVVCNTHAEEEKYMQIFIRMPEGKRPLGRIKHIKIDPKKTMLTAFSQTVTCHTIISVCLLETSLALLNANN
jgi:hypothetical protein